MEITDVTPNPVWRKRMFRRWLLVGSLLLIALAWPAYRFLAQPELDRRAINHSLQLLKADPRYRNFVESVDELSGPAQTRLLLNGFSNKEIMAVDSGISGARSAVVRRAILERNSAAMLDYGVALKDGVYGEQRFRDALQAFEVVSDWIDPGLKVSDPEALLLRARILDQGLGTTRDSEKARSIAEYALQHASDNTLLKLSGDIRQKMGVISEIANPALFAALGKRLVDLKSEDGYWLVRDECPKHPKDLNTAQLRVRLSCIEEASKQAAEAGIPDGINHHAGNILTDTGNVRLAEQWFSSTNDASRSFDDKALYSLTKILLTTDSKSLSLLYKRYWDILVDATHAPDYLNHFVQDPYYLWYKFEKSRENRNLNWNAFLVALTMHGHFVNAPEKVPAWVLDSLNSRELARHAAHPDIVNTAATMVASLQTSEKIEPQPSAITKPDPKSTPSPAARSPDTVQTRDREYQNFSGYIRGQPQLSSGGLSTFTIDNRQGGNDALARIYLNGSKPASRSMYIRKGQLFSAENLKPGSYIFRYRFVGSDETFEANNPFELKETVTESGTRFSKITVTLFKVADGNLTTKKIHAAAF